MTEKKALYFYHTTHGLTKTEKGYWYVEESLEEAMKEANDGNVIYKIELDQAYSIGTKQSSLLNTKD